MPEKSPTTIVSLTAENVKRLKAIRVEPTGSTVVIGGRNGQGKTSLLDCIAMALGGAAAAPAEPIRRGEKRGQIILETEELIVTRKFSKSGTTLEVTNKDGQKYNGPQGVLDKLTASLSFDPLAFVRADRKAQFKQLQTLLGIDTETIDAERKAVFERRTVKNRAVAEAKAVVDSLPSTGPARVEISELLDELSRAEQINAGVAGLEREAMEAESQFEKAKGNLVIATNKASDLRARLLAAEQDIEKAKSDCEQAKQATFAASERVSRSERIDAAPIKSRIGEAEATNKAAAKVEERKAKAADLTVLEDEANMMTEHLKKLDMDRAALLSGCAMPVPGIGFDSDGVTLNGLPLDQASGAEQLRLGLAVACALNPSLRVMLIRDGSLLDDDSMKLVEEMATAHGAQVWIERVGNDGKCTVVIEDGEALDTPAGDAPGKPAAGATSTTPAAPKTAPTELETPAPAAAECLY